MTVQADKCPMCPVQPQQRGVASNRKLGSIHSGAFPRLHPPDKSCSQASSMASIPLPTARRRVPTSCSSGGGTRAGPSTCQTNTSRGSSGSSTVSQCSRTKPVSPGSSTFNTGHSTCQTIAFVRGRELHQAGGEGGVEEALLLQEAACSCLTPSLAIQAPLQEVAKLLLAGGKGGDQVLSAVSRHGRAHLTTSSDPA